MATQQDTASPSTGGNGNEDGMTSEMLAALENGDGGVSEAMLAEAGIIPLPARFPLTPIPIPWLIQASGLYEFRQSLPILPTPIPQRIPIPIPRPIIPLGRAEEEEPSADSLHGIDTALSPIVPWWFLREELRLDVDGPYPLMRASGTLYNGLSLRVHWIANLASTGTNTYSGYIWFKDGQTSALPYTNVSLQVTKSWFVNQRKVTVTFSGRGAPTRVRTYAWKSASFHDVEMEFDHVQGTSPVTSIQTGAHPNRPPGLPSETLSIETVFRRAGFGVTKTGADNQIPIAAAGVNARWSDMEMHDAMQIHWSKFANTPQWSLWVLFASLHDQGTSLGGIMFDDIGPNHRQGTSLFNDSFIKNAPSGDANPSAWVARMKFWTACHEMGHAFNLAHSWQKALVSGGRGPWIPLANETEARSFMNYPYNVSGGEAAFFSDFEYRFTDNELLFLRHAPERFVQQGNADWFDDHGFEQARVSPASSYRLEARVHRTLDYFEFMEPVSIELKLTNVSAGPVVIDGGILEHTHDLTVVVKRRGDPAQMWSPYAHHFHQDERRVLEAGESLYGQYFISVGPNGWAIDEPGVYTVQASLQIEEEDVVSNALDIRVAPPRGYDEEFLAQEVFSEEVGRTLAFNGTRHFDQANDTLREVVDQMPERRVAKHARLALGNPLTRAYKLLVAETPDTPVEEVDQRFKMLKPEPEEAKAVLTEALVENADMAADTLGHIEYRSQVEQLGEFLADEGDRDAAASTLQTAAKTLKSRNVLDRVVEDLEDQRQGYAKSTKSSRKSKKNNRCRPGRPSQRPGRSS